MKINKLIWKKNRWLHKAKTSDSEEVWKINRKNENVTQRTSRQTNKDCLKIPFLKWEKKNGGHILRVEYKNVGMPEIKDQQFQQAT